MSQHPEFTPQRVVIARALLRAAVEACEACGAPKGDRVPAAAACLAQALAMAGAAGLGRAQLLEVASFLDEFAEAIATGEERQ